MTTLRAPRRTLTITEYFTRLALRTMNGDNGASIMWELQHDGSIRASMQLPWYDDRASAVEACPLSCFTNPPTCCSEDGAGEDQAARMGLSSADAGRIIAAADYGLDHDPDVRRLLLHACRIDEETEAEHPAIIQRWTDDHPYQAAALRTWESFVRRFFR